MVVDSEKDFGVEMAEAETTTVKSVGPCDVDAPFQILSLDGGGQKGLFSAAVLAEFERDLDTRVVDHFDLITGTSTGGLIALGLGGRDETTRNRRLLHDSRIGDLRPRARDSGADVQVQTQPQEPPRCARDGVSRSDARCKRKATRDSIVLARWQ